jgi:hypothetical protein
MSIDAPERDDVAVAPVAEMTTSVDGVPLNPDGDGGVGAVPGSEVRDASADDAQPVSVLLTSLAAFLAAAAAGWMVAGIFRGALPRVIGIVGPGLGAGMVWASYKTKRPSMVQYLAAPVAILLGAILMVPDTSGGSANLPSLVVEAIRGGGISQPPVPFDPGWKFLLLVLTALVATGAAALAVSLNRPKVGLVLPIPLIFGAALVQPPGATVLSTVVALVLGIGGMAVAFGVDLAKEGATSGQFEARRIGRGAGVMAALIAVLVVLSQVGFLFPSSDAEQVIPPKRPEQPSPEPDREIFTVKSAIQVPWRVGTLDVYKDNAWMTPPFRTSRLVDVVPGAALPFRGKKGTEKDTSVPAAPRSADGKTFTATFRVSDVKGNTVPIVLTPTGISASDVKMQYDPRTQMLRLPGGRPRSGTTYTVVAPLPPTAAELKSSPKPGAQVAEYLQVPSPPPGVRQLLDQAPKTNAFDRLQFVRNAFYQVVVAAGSGNPVDVPPSRVDEMLRGKEASPFEITAAEVLLARWSGVPARVGFGYFGGKRLDTEGAQSTFSVRPKQGATWLEAYFEGHGWVPIVGIPPQAKSSINNKDKKDEPTVRPTDELALIVVVPIKLQTISLLFQLVRFWLYRVVPWLFLGLVAVLFYPGLLKLARRTRRRRWAANGGPRERIMAAYAELRDAVNDYNFGDPIHTPLEFVGDLAPDPEHTELAWLVTRTLWGDLSRDLRPEDAEAAEEMAASITRRMRRANSGLPRLVALGSRASLRDPYTYEVPNLWPERSPVRQLRDRLGGLRRILPGRLAGRAAAPAALMLIVVLAGGLLSGCARTVDLTSKAAAERLPARLVPGELSGLRFVREVALEGSYAKAGKAALVDHGRVFSLHQGDEIQGSLQVAAFKPGLDQRDEELRRGVLQSVGGGRFELTRIGTERVYKLEMPEQQMYLWFPPGQEYYELMVGRKAFADADRVFVQLLAYQRSGSTRPVDINQTTTLDPRRGIVD